MDNCIFCKIALGKLPSSKIYEDDLVLGFLDINPVNKGHSLLIPKQHFSSFEETPESLVSYMFNKSKEIRQAIKQATSADYVLIMVEGIDVPHFHIKFVPRFLNDNVPKWPTTQYESDEERENFAEKIRQAIKS